MEWLWLMIEKDRTIAAMDSVVMSMLLEGRTMSKASTSLKLLSSMVLICCMI